jgi:peptide/nickel transport system ATP-binding protein
MSDAPLLDARDVRVHYPAPRSAVELLRRAPARAVRAVDGVSLALGRGETLGVVGESGCGKSTLGRALVGLEPLTGGEVRLAGAPVTTRMPPPQRRRAQMIFQDPYGALNPLLTVREALAEPVRVHRLRPAGAVEGRVHELMTLVGLPRDLEHRRPASLSGGQAQRVGIARALAVEPDLLVADECVSALDVSIQAQVLNLLTDLRRSLGLTLLFIAHDLGVVRQVCDRVVVLYLGRVVEEGPTAEVFARPRHPYTRSLIDAAPVLHPDAPPPGPPPAGEPPSPTQVPPGCAFQTRCPHALPACRVGAPPPLLGASGHRAACLLDGGRGLTYAGDDRTPDDTDDRLAPNRRPRPLEQEPT